MLNTVVFGVFMYRLRNRRRQIASARMCFPMRGPATARAAPRRAMASTCHAQAKPPQAVGGAVQFRRRRDPYAPE